MIAGMERRLQSRARARRAVAVCIAGLTCGLLPQTAVAQRAASMRLGVSVNGALTQTNVATRLGADSTQSRLVNTMHGALIGCGIGAGVGLVAALLGTQFGNVTDHSEDATAYIALGAFGALIGYVVGGVAGFMQPARP